MPVDYYPNKSAEDLLLILDTLQKRQTAGTLTEVSAGGVRTVKTVTPGNSAVEVEILRVLYSLFKRDSATYPNPYRQRRQRSRGLYYQ